MKRLQPVAAEKEDTTSFATLHVPNNLPDLHAELNNHLDQLIPSASLAVLLYEENGTEANVALTKGTGCPLETDKIVRLDTWGGSDLQRLPLPYNGSVLGELQISATLRPEDQEQLQNLINHYSVALVNITLN